MNKKIKIFFLITLVSLIILPSALGVLTDSLVAYWTMDNADLTGDQCEDVHSTNDGTIVLATTGAVGILGEAYNFSGSGQSNTVTMPSIESDPMTISFWVKTHLLNQPAGIFTCKITYEDNYGFTIYQWNSDDELEARGSGTTVFEVLGFFTEFLNEWVHVVVTFDGTDVEFYRNGSSVGSGTVGAVNPTVNPIIIGFHNEGSSVEFDGALDEIGIWSRVLSPAEIEALYNEGEALAYPLEAPIFPFSVTATDLYDNSSLSNITAYITNSTDSFHNSTGTGTLILNVTHGIYDITVTSNQSGGYFNTTYVDYNVSNDLAAKVFQSILILNATDLTDDSQIISFGAAVPLQFNLSNSSGHARLLLKAGEYTVVGNESDHLNTTKTISISALEIKFETFEFGSKHLHVNATNIQTGSAILTFNVFLEDLNSDFIGNISTTSGDATFSLDAGNFTITTTATDYVVLVENVTVDTIHTNHTSRLQKENSILIRIFAEGNQSVLNWTNVTASFDSDTSVFSSKSDNGTMYLEDVTPEEYTITFTASNFDSRDYFINLISGSNVNLDVFLISSGVSTEITFTIVDSSTSLNLEGVIVSVAKKINLSYVTIAQKESDISGVVVFDLDQDIKYRFTLSKTEFDTRTFDLTPTSTTYTIELTPEAVIDYTTIYDRIDFTLIPSSTNLATGPVVDFSIIAASLDGTVIDYFGVNSTFNSTNFINNISTSPSGGTATIQLNFDGFMGSVGVTYFIDVDGFDPVRIDRNFYVSNVTASNVSVSGIVDIFDDELGTSKQGMLLKAIMAVAFTIIIMATLASMGIRDRRLNVVAACGLGFFMIFGWIPTGITIAIMVILLGSFFIGGLKGGTD